MDLKRIVNLCLIGLFLSSLLVGFARTETVAAQDVPPQVCVTNQPNVNNFPDVSLDFRAYDAKYSPINNVQTNSIQIQDNSSTVQPKAIRQNVNGIGLNVYFLVDQGNRTDQALALNVLRRFGDKYMVEGVDHASIYTNFNSKGRFQGPWALLPPTASVNEFVSKANTLSDYDINDYYTLRDTAKEVISQIRSQNPGCAQPTMMVFIMGPDVLTTAEIDKTIEDAAKLQIPVHVVHARKNNAFDSNEKYKHLASGTNGIYVQAQLEKTQEFSQLDPSLFSQMALSRMTYTADYRSPDGSTGDHTVNLLWQGQTNPGSNAATRYAMRVDAAKVVINSPINGAEIKRTSTQRTETGYTFDTDNVPVDFTVSWPDGHPRQIKLAELLITTTTGRETAGRVENPADPGALKFDLDLRRFTQAGDNAVRVEVRVVDELGVEISSSPVEISVKNIVPAAVEAIRNPLERYILYGLAGVVVVLVVILIIFWRRLSKMAKSGAVGAFVNKVRKTIVGGRSTKPIAFLKILDGPTKMINEEIKITTESISLGRDPAMADYTFYSDSNSSISGLHARIERKNGQWFVTGISQSGNETFVDGKSITNFQPVPIQSGQQIRLGYYGQQPVEFLFSLPGGMNTPVETVQTDTKKTKVNLDARMPEVAPEKPTKVGSNGSEVDDNVFDSFREME